MESSEQNVAADETEIQEVNDEQEEIENEAPGDEIPADIEGTDRDAYTDRDTNPEPAGGDIRNRADDTAGEGDDRECDPQPVGTAVQGILAGTAAGAVCGVTTGREPLFGNGKNAVPDRGEGAGSDDDDLGVILWPYGSDIGRDL